MGTTVNTVAATADVSPESVIGEGSTVWHLAQIRESARLGSRVCPQTGNRYEEREGTLREL